MRDVYTTVLEMETTPQALAATVDYLAGRIKPFLQTLEPVLICYPDEGPASLGGIFKEAVLQCSATPVFWGPDYRWKELLRIAFDTHANTVIGHPRVVLGLMKLARATGTPLSVYDVIACGDPFPRWMIEDMKNGLDCRVWGCYAVSSGPAVAGFSCEQEAGIHIREDVFVPQLCCDGDDMPGINRGKLQLAYAKKPGLIFDPNVVAVLHYQPCSCGCDEPRVAYAQPIGEEELFAEQFESIFLPWASILDYCTEQTESGIALELVVFPGESLPKLPSVARLNLRPWNPEVDIPFCMHRFAMKIPEKIHEID